MVGVEPTIGLEPIYLQLIQLVLNDLSYVGLGGRGRDGGFPSFQLGTLSAELRAQ